MFVILDTIAILSGIGMVASASAFPSYSPTLERAGGALIVMALVGLGDMLAHAAG